MAKRMEIIPGSIKDAPYPRLHRAIKEILKGIDREKPPSITEIQLALLLTHGLFATVDEIVDTIIRQSPESKKEMKE